MRIKNNIKFFFIFTVLFIALCIFPFSVYLYSKYTEEISNRDKYIAVQNELLEQLDLRINLIHKNIINDLEYLLSSYLFKEYINGKESLEFLSKEWALFSFLNGCYDQIRFLDKDGNEKIRINYSNGNSYIVENYNLQNKKDRYYFKEVAESNELKILVSYLDLNIENGQIEYPLKPMIRYSAPIIDNDGNFNGVIVLNYLADKIFDIIQGEELMHDSHIYMINNKGYFLYGKESSSLWGFMYEDKKNETIFNYSDMPHNFDEKFKSIDNKLYIKRKIFLSKTNGYKIKLLDDYWVIITESKDSILYDHILYNIFSSVKVLLIIYISICLAITYTLTHLINKVISITENRSLLRTIMNEVVSALEVTSVLDDDDTGYHIRRVCEYSYILAKSYGLSESKSREIMELASLHDIGKIGVHDSILKKKGPLTDVEWEEMKMHVLYGKNVIRNTKLSSVAYNIICYHHENWDGTGYMGKLKGEAIPLEARIVTIADVYDALRNKRCYKPAMSHVEAIQIILQESGKKFDPKIVSCFLYEEDKFNKVSIRLK